MPVNPEKCTIFTNEKDKKECYSLVGKLNNRKISVVKFFEKIIENIDHDEECNKFMSEISDE